MEHIVEMVLRRGSITREIANAADEPRGAFRLACSDPLRAAAVHAQKSMARLLLAAGATEVISLHGDPLFIRAENDSYREIARLTGVRID